MTLSLSSSMQRYRWAVPGRLLLALGLGLASLAAAAMDDPPGRVGRVGDTQGQVWMMEAGQGEWANLQRNRPFTTGDRIATDRGARAELQIGSTTMRVAEGSDLQVMRLDDDRIEVMVNGGSVSLRVREPEVAREVALQTGDGNFSPRGPGLFRVDHDDRGSMGESQQGELQFDARDSSLTLRQGQRAEFWQDPNDRATHYTWAQPSNDAFDQWVRNDEQRDARRVANRFVSPEMTGAEDLDRNGRWIESPDYGALWTPTVVAAGWAPYRYGHWAFVSPWGWTWVDDAPWGFAPFHYGRWVMWGGNWCWAPGQYVRRPVYAPALVAWVGGPRLGVSVQVGGPTVGWIPLAPREVYYPAYRVSPVYVQNINVTHVRITEREVRDHREPVMYGNRGVPGGITVVPANALAQRQPVAVARQRVSDDVVTRNLRDQRALQTVAPPAPTGAVLAPRVVPTPAAVANAPRPPMNGGPVSRDERSLDRRANGDNRREAQRGGEGDAVRALPVTPAQPVQPVSPVQPSRPGEGRVPMTQDAPAVRETAPRRPVVEPQRPSERPIERPAEVTPSRPVAPAPVPAAPRAPAIEPRQPSYEASQRPRQVEPAPQFQAPDRPRREEAAPVERRREIDNNNGGNANNNGRERAERPERRDRRGNDNNN